MAYDVGAAFERIENDLIESMIRNMKRHKIDEIAEKKEWVQWQALQLKYLEEYKIRNRKKYGKEFAEINKRIEQAIKEARKDAQSSEEARILETIGKTASPEGIHAQFFKFNDKKMDALLTSIKDDLTRAEYAVLRRANDQYRKIIFDAQVAVNSGAKTYEQAVDMATKDFLNAGIDCIRYKNGARHNISSYAQMALRTANKRASLIGAADARNKWGMNTVLVNKRNNPCPKCLPFVGRILIDDVYGAHMNNAVTNLPNFGGTLSNAIEAGFLHPNCKDSYTTYFPGISEIDPMPTQEEVEEMQDDYDTEQKKNVALRNYKRFQRLHDGALDKDNQSYYAAQMDRWMAAYRKYYRG